MTPFPWLDARFWQEAAQASGWNGMEGSNPWYCHRPGRAGGRRVYLSAGIHGDEPAGPEALALLLREKRIAPEWEVFLFPVLNPIGCALGTRASASGLDLNRDYLHPKSPEVAAHVDMLRTLPPIDVAICLHEDWEAAGVYLYYLHPGHEPDGEAARAVLDAMSGIIPLETAPVIDGRAADHGLIHRVASEFEGDQWPEAIYLGKQLASRVYTLETPSSLPLDMRVRAHLAGVEAILRLSEQRETRP